jgi:hypothetical protein
MPEQTTEAPRRFRHRVAFNCDFVLDIETESADTPADELEAMVTAVLRRHAPERDLLCLADNGWSVMGLPVHINARVYPRIAHQPNQCSDETDRLEDFTAEDSSEIE